MQKLLAISKNKKKPKLTFFVLFGQQLIANS